MNLALPVLALLSLAGLLLRRREIGIPWAALRPGGDRAAPAGARLETASPAPRRRSPRGPWQGVADPAAGNSNLRDVTRQVQPWLLFLRHELRAGRLPFWDPYQFSGSPYWSNGSGAPLFPLHLLFAALPVQLGFAPPVAPDGVGGCGAWLWPGSWARPPAALVAALVFPLSGMITSFLLFPMGNTHALVPGCSSRSSAWRRGGSWVGLAVAGGLQLLGGHPETPVFTAILAGIYLLAGAPERRPVAAWAAFSPDGSSRCDLRRPDPPPLQDAPGERQVAPPGRAAAPSRRWGPLLRGLLPDLFGNPSDGTWWGPYNFAATAVYAGVLTMPFAVAGLAAARGNGAGWRGA